MANQGFGTPELEGQAVKNHRLSFRVTLVGSTTLGSTTGYADGSVQVWHQANSATAPSAANFASLLSTATPTVIGIYIPDGKATKIHRVTVDAKAIHSASMTDSAVTYKGVVNANGGSEGSTVAAGGDLAFQISCTGLKLTDAANTHQFSVCVDYDTL